MKGAVALLVAFLLAWACRPQVPPGPAPEYERPRVTPWDAGSVQDPLAAIEAEGEWVDDEPSTAAGGAPPEPATPVPVDRPESGEKPGESRPAP